MANGPPSSSWHPALMPNATPPPPSAPAADDGVLSRHLSDPQSITEPLAEASFADEAAADDGDAWLVEDDADPPTQNPLEADGESYPHESQPEYRSADVTSEHSDAPVVEEARPRTVASQHSSSMSFARTVSHEVSFHDDDDRSDVHVSDSAHQTATFPSPAPAQGPEFENHSNIPLPSTQALNVLEETERALEFDAQNYSPDEATDCLSPEPPLPQVNNWPEQQSMNSTTSEEQDMEARYEEGVPLMSRDNIALDSGLTGSFADGDDDDNFFASIRDTGAEAVTDVEMPAMQRKSTTQAMGGHLTASDDSASDAEVRDSSAQPDGLVQAPVEDLATKWEAAFAGDDDNEFLIEDSTTANDAVDASAFLGSDDEGLLDDEEAIPAPPPAPASSVLQQPSTTSIYTPMNIPSRQPSSPYVPTANAPLPTPTQTPFTLSHVPAQPPRPDPSRAQSFADKSKGGYSSPYDLPTDLLSNTMKPRKRTSLQQLPREQPPPPPRSTSMYATSPSTVQAPGANQAFSPSSLRNQSSFFEELPVTVRSRPSSRQSNPTQQHPNLYAPPAQSPVTPQIPGSPAGMAPQPLSGVSGLVAPEKASPYAAVSHHPAVSMPPPSATASRYSPAPVAQQGAVSAARYSPAPSAPRPSGSYGASAPPAASPQSVLPHLPRTSSPLAHFEYGSLPNGEAPLTDRRSNSFEPRLTRVSSLPPTREVEEEEDVEGGNQPLLANRSVSAVQPNRPALAEPKHYSAPSVATVAPTPPPSSQLPAAVPSSPKAAYSYIPTAQPGFLPPPRPSTQSPVENRPVDPSARPSTAHAVSDPAPAALQAAYAPTTRKRGQTLSANMLVPTDGRERDELQRWRGAPLLTWGVGGTVVTSFPKSIPRYTPNQTMPTIWRTCGELKVQNIKDILPLEDRLAKFPGPLKGKSKKKEALSWLAAGIDTQEKDVSELEFRPQSSLEAKRGAERLLLWKLLRVFIEFDGTLEGNAAVEKAVKDVLSPGMTSHPFDMSAPPLAAPVGAPVTSMMADGIDPAAMDQIRRHLLDGNSEAAVWSAVDKRLWGHAMLISHTISADLYRRVAQEFVRKEVNYPGHNNESVAALYKVLSGNFDDCVDELVPIHARVGLQLVSNEPVTEPARGNIDGLDKWRETLTLILNNRSPDDARALNALGKLLSSYGRAEAAQTCFIFSRSLSVFGGLDDQTADFVLLGSDHRQQSDQFAKETEALQLSEVYEYGLSLAGGPSLGAPHLAAYKLQYAVTLAEHGYQEKALQYCDAIDAAMMSQTRRSPYHHSILETAVHDFTTRLRQAPKDASSSWISKPSMNKVSEGMWKSFNKFVAGDDGGNGANGGNGGEGDTGPFARVASTPNLSRSPSISNFEAYGGGHSPGHGVNPSAAASRYAPAAATQMINPIPPAPTSSGRTSSEYPRNPYEPTSNQGAISPQAPISSGYAPTRQPVTGLGFETVMQNTARLVPNGNEANAGGHLQPRALQESPNIYAKSERPAHDADQGYRPHAYGYEPPQIAPIQHQDDAGAGYESPSYQPYGYEPPSYNPDAVEDGDKSPQKNKSFMDDEDDMPAAKSKAEKDRENEEMFRKAAEEDAKRAAAQQLAKKGWGFTGWFGGGKKNESNIGDAGAAGKPIRAKLGEASSFVYDPDLKRWINKKPGAENVEVKKATPPPPRAAPRPAATPPPPLSGPPRAGLALQENLGLAPPSALSRSASNSDMAAGPLSRPPSRPTTSMSNASSIDDLLSAAAPRKGTQKKARKSGRYVDVMAK
ncbi:hypothetical protein L249_5753 [Ophiocordyceps polyrhachis-furcata BCC 54312]|uniref:Protein transport protein sec16 n=1 Tax=Ophiocordyceps polyrhachis-furcata BCC 54312 TaxID=1330021 RepID=A0A367L0C9_9HYPO|nr:hypothetical protein L249_5753 [Ophiocordyceps polyrhachis-furcata BCC 54312]